MYGMREVGLHELLHPISTARGTVEGELVTSTEPGLEVSLGAQTPELAKVHDAYTCTQVVSLLHGMCGQDLRTKYHVVDGISIRYEL